MLARKALAGTAAAPKEYVEDVFSTYLYTGTGSAQTITNNIDLSGEGGLVWTKRRNDASNNRLYDTERGALYALISDDTGAQANVANSLTSFNANGFSLGSSSASNVNTGTYASWTFRKAKKFFDVVTYTGNGTAGRTVSHNLGSVPGVIIVKRTDTTSDWRVYHRSLGATYYLGLDSTAAAAQATTIWNDTEPTSTVFSVGSSANTNASGGTYVAYLFAHDAGGFGDAGDQSVISCGSVTATGGNVEVNLGWEPQWVLVKNASVSENWRLLDNMRGITNAGTKWLFPNTSGAETDNSGWNELTATGFKLLGWGSSGNNYIYIAIRRGPMKTPTSGTDVYNAITMTSTAPDFVTGFVTDFALRRDINETYDWYASSRLTGTEHLLTNTTSAASSNAGTTWDFNNGYGSYNYGTLSDFYSWNFRRAPGFFDVVCYTGTGANRTVSHNLGVAPELMIVKCRSVGGTNRGWWTYAATLGNTKALEINSTNNAQTSSVWNNTTPTASVFSVDNTYLVNENGTTYVAYLFASLSGVSKIGTYTGNGSSVTVTTDFQPRFILVKRTDSTGDWIVGDSARGLVAGNDPYLELNTTDAEVTNEDWVDISSTSFTVNQTTNNANVNTGTYIYLAVA